MTDKIPKLDWLEIRPRTAVLAPSGQAAEKVDARAILIRRCPGARQSGDALMRIPRCKRVFPYPNRMSKGRRTARRHAP